MAGDSPAVAVLKGRCVACHDSQGAQSKLDLSTRESALRGGERGPAIVPGDSPNSPLYQFASHQIRPFMPPAGAQLSPEELKTLASWIDSGASWPSESVGDSKPPLFVTAVKPIFEQHCVECHHPGAGKSGGLDLTSREKLLEGGDHGQVIALNDPESSELLARLRHTKAPGMPFNRPQLPAESVAKVAKWIRSGAPYDAAVAISKAPVTPVVDSLGISEAGTHPIAEIIGIARVVE